MKSTSVRGTTFNTNRAGLREGMNAGKPNGMSGTVNRQYEGDQSGNRQEGVSTGTPYVSTNGNPAEAKRVVSSDKYGHVESNWQGDMNNASSNGNGTVFDGIDKGNGYSARAERAMDSPVPGRAPMFEGRTIAQENAAHLGSGVPRAMIEDNLDAIGGVMSRGMDPVDKPTDSAESLLEDDTLRNMGKGGAVG